MKGYALDPEALADVEEIVEYIAQDNPAAAGRVIDKVEATLEALVSFPPSRTQTSGTHVKASALHFGAGIFDCLCAG